MGARLSWHVCNPAGLLAGERGLPWAPVGGILGSDLVAQRTDWQVRDGVLTIPALRPDVALFHARWADEAGNVWVGRRRELATAAHAARTVVVTVEEVRAGDMLEDELLAPGVISSIYVSAVARAPRTRLKITLPRNTSMLTSTTTAPTVDRRLRFSQPLSTE